MVEPSSGMLLESLARRPTLDRAVVEILAVAFESLTRTELVAALNTMGVRDSAGRRVGSGMLNPLLESLAADGFVTYAGRAECQQPLREHLARKLAAELRFEALAAAVRSSAVMDWGKSDWNRAVREVRCAIHSSQPGDSLELNERCKLHYGRNDAFVQFCQPIDAAWLDALPQDVTLEVLTQILRGSVPTFAPTDEALALLELELVPGPEITVEQERVYVEQLLLRGAIDDTRDLLTSGTHPAEAGMAALIRGDRDGALTYFEHVPKPPGEKSRCWVIPGIAGVFHALALATSAQDSHLQRARQLVVTAKRDSVEHRSAYLEIESLLDFRRHGIKDKRDPMFSSSFARQWARHAGPNQQVDLWMAALVSHWIHEELPAEVGQWLEGAVVRAQEAHYDWIAFELAELLARSNTLWRARANAMGREIGADVQPLADLLRVKPAWERKLEMLSTITAPPPPPPAKGKQAERGSPDARLVWIVSVGHGWLDVEPRHQTRDAKGVWSKGRKVALKRLFERDPELDFLSDLDRRLCAKVKRYESAGWGRHTDVSYSIGGLDTYRLLAGHPALFARAEDPTPVELVFTKPCLIAQETNSDVRIMMHPRGARGEFAVVQDGPYRIEVCELTEEQRKVAELLDGELVVPRVARDRVETVLAALAPTITVQSDVVPAGPSRSVTAEAQLHLRLTRRADCLEARLRSFPLGTKGPACVPGQGQRLVAAVIGRGSLQAERDFDKERRGLEGLCARCSTLDSAAVGPADWRFEGIDGSLAFLLELSRFDDDGVVVAWSTEDRFEMTPELDEASLHLTMRGVSHGFSFDGELHVEGSKPVPLFEVLGLLTASPARYLELSDGRFLALTDAFRSRLAHLARYRRTGRDKSSIIPALAVPAVQPLIDAAGVANTDARWKAQLVRMQAAQAMEVCVPSTLKVQLRPYQEEGMRWMARLAAWGAGACLADDMGLGKTVQALSVILMRADHGPTLVAAPTSVCGTWLAETARFAPTLNVVQLGEGDRTSVINALGPRDLLLIGYGLLHSEADRLARVDWTTVILDEAQLIKNPLTKRFNAAIRLRGGFRLATTGTPIENRLEELWSLFEFINPGLLGSRDGFAQRFATPIERDGNREARASLRKLVQPFILRRNKSQVLDELPARTDIDVRLEMNEAEAALYEAQRQQALSDLAADVSGLGAIKILAWLTTLRRTCCNPRLTVRDHAPPSCKLAAFIEIIEQLRGGGNKALVFSQFVDHLTILREWLDQEKISYQYLDGGTSTRERTRRVTEFQAGKGDLFLISLRAGGLGLNLTAADHVIHMDPWWNPAVEDQASDRAHRIGQQRPVTVYRLIARDTIEERIVALHRHKRDIAEQLLQGADITGRLSTEELLALLQEPARAETA